jgi:hypothetical protein
MPDTVRRAPRAEAAGRRRALGSTWLPVVLLALAATGAPTRAQARSLAVAWNDPGGRGAVAAMRVTAPWAFHTAPLEVGANTVLHASGAALYAVSPTDGSLTAIDVRSWTVSRVYDLGGGSDPQDVAVGSGGRAYVTRSGATHLLRLDLGSGETTEVVDLGPFADPDGIPDLGRMTVHQGRLFVQLRRLDASEPGGFARPAALAVIDLASEQLVDADPVTPGVQPIALAGTPPRFRMQMARGTRRLFVSATGGFFDDGGVEAIDLDTLASTGLLLAEADGETGADLGAFVLVSPDRGFLTFSTDLLLSSHLVPFTFGGDVGPELHVSLDYFAPALVHERRGRLVFAPDGSFGTTGVRVFDAVTGAPRTLTSVATAGAPTDLLLLRRSPR